MFSTLQLSEEEQGGYQDVLKTFELYLFYIYIYIRIGSEKVRETLGLHVIQISFAFLGPLQSQLPSLPFTASSAPSHSGC